MLFEPADGATPLTPEELAGLRPAHVALRSELNELEQQNILDAVAWAKSRRRALFTETFVQVLHRRMFNAVWKWAGRFRTTERNIGVDPWEIRPRLRLLIQDVQFWAEHNTYPPDELAVRFHHRLVWIHPFPNGNGRHARLMADLFAEQNGRPRFTWGSANLAAQGPIRQQYIAALKQADDHNIDPLIQFARS